MTRPQIKYDRFPGFLAAASTDTPAARLAAIDRALADGIGHKLFTVLVVNWARNENQRCYSSLPDAYPVGGAKPITAGSLTDVLAGQCRFLDSYDAVKAAFPDMAGRIEISKFNLLLRQANQPDKAYAMKDALLASPELATTPAALNQIAYTVLEGPGVSRRDYPFALAFAEKADEAAKGQDWSIADTLARAQFATGDKAKAVESQTRAIALAKAAKIGGDELAELETMLKVFKGEQKPAEETK